MTDDEARTLAAIVATADGGCYHCVASLCDALSAAFPAYVWEALDWYSATGRVEVRRQPEP